MTNSQIEIYQIDNGITEISVRLEDETVWLNLNQLTDLFQKDKSVISRHISNIFKEKELDKNSVVAKNATTAKDGKVYQVDYYNLDVIISVGYRIKSQRGTQFRIWANRILKEYLIKGYSINERRISQQAEQLKELQQSVKMLANVLEYKEITKSEGIGLLKIISDYAYALDILDKYDYQTLEITETSGKEIYQLTYNEAVRQIQNVKKIHGNSPLFGNEKMNRSRVLFQQFIKPLMELTFILALKKKQRTFYILLQKTILSLMEIRELQHFYFCTSLKKMKFF